MRRSGHRIFRNADLRAETAGDKIAIFARSGGDHRRAIELRNELEIRPELTQRFIVVDGRQLGRQLGIAIVHAAGAKVPDFVVFAEPGDMILLGARSLEGLNVCVDAQRKQFVPGGPVLAGVVAA